MFYLCVDLKTFDFNISTPTKASNYNATLAKNLLRSLTYFSDRPQWHPGKLQLLYSQTLPNDHLRITTTCQQRQLFWDPVFLNYLNYVSTTATIFESQGWLLYTDLTVIKNLTVNKIRSFDPISMKFKM